MHLYQLFDYILNIFKQIISFRVMLAVGKLWLLFWRAWRLLAPVFRLVKSTILKLEIYVFSISPIGLGILYDDSAD